MADTRAFPDSTGDRSQTGIVSKIRLENFMCHNNLEIELGSRVNFITGQNGSGKSAILTALCVAFGCRAKSTDRASTLKDFIKTGCSSALVHVEIKNEGEDSFKPETYGNVIIIERRISESTSSLVLKDHQGKKIATRREDLRELVEHFNIDVENPCVVMSQDKSREFLHSGNDKDKFKFFFKATLLSQVDELLNSIKDHLYKANAMVLSLEEAIAPVEKELKDLQGKIKSMEQVEEIAQEAQKLRKKLAWSWVYDVDKQLHEQSAAIVNLKEVRMAQCQERIDQSLGKMDELRDIFAKKKAQSDGMMARTSEVRRKKDELEQSLSLATKERLELEQEHDRKIYLIRNMMKRVKLLEQQVNEVHEQHMRSTQAEESELEEKLKELQDEFNRENSKLESLKEEEDALSESLLIAKEEIRKIANEIEGYERKQREIRSVIHDCRLHQTNKVTAFGGARVTNLLQAIERHHHRFKRPPIGPIGAHVTLVHGDKWAVAVENAIGNLLNAFIVTDHKDSLLLRACAREANYNHLRIIIYDFSRPRLNIPNHMLPQTNHPTTISVIHSDSHTVVNVLVDVGSAERQVLVGDYAMGTNIAFDQRISNLKEVYTLEGHRMFSRGSAQTILPANKNARSGRLCSSYDDQIKNYEQEAANLQGQAQQCRGKKRDAEKDLQILQDKHQSVKRRRTDVEKKVMHKDLALQDLKKSYAAEASAGPASSVDELHLEKIKIQDEIQEKENLLKKFQVRLNEAVSKAKELKLLYDNLKESAQKEIDALDQASHELTQIEEDLQFAESKKIHYERVMKERVLDPLKDAEAHYRELEHHRKENYRKASIICPESEVETLEGHEGRTPEQLSALLNKINRRLQQESQRFEESIDDIRVLYESKERKILRKRRTYKGFREKLTAMEKALDLRWSKFQRNATLLKRQLTWQFNGHLKKKGFSGQIKVSYEDKTLAIEVKMPQDASNSNVRDTRGLSGGERSFSTLCFALSLHEMTEAPFRAMDEFDVFMDAVSRKISLDTLVDFALSQGSQWIFITPHDISMVKQDARIKKQQMAAPRA